MQTVDCCYLQGNNFVIKSPLTLGQNRKKQVNSAVFGIRVRSQELGNLLKMGLGLTGHSLQIGLGVEKDTMFCFECLSPYSFSSF